MAFDWTLFPQLRRNSSAETLCGSTEHRSLSRTLGGGRALPGAGSLGRVGRRGSRTALHTGAAAQGPRGPMGRFPGSCGPRCLFCSSTAEGAEIASWHPRNVNCFAKMLKFAGDGGLMISTLPGADRHKTKSPRASVLSHRVVSHAKLVQDKEDTGCEFTNLQPGNLSAGHFSFSRG